MSLRNGVPGAVRWRCPITSSRVRGRIRTASGAALAAARSSASSHKLSTRSSLQLFSGAGSVSLTAVVADRALQPALRGDPGYVDARRRVGGGHVESRGERGVEAVGRVLQVKPDAGDGDGVGGGQGGKAASTDQGQHEAVARFVVVEGDGG